MRRYGVGLRRCRLSGDIDRDGDIAGRGVANPAAFLLSAAMCADHLAHRSDDHDHSDDAANDLRHRATRLRAAVIATLKTNPTPDLGGTNTTSGFAGDVAARLTS